jgi:hypothetical protein
MISIRIVGAQIVLDQRSTNPLVYLDHAPLMEVAEHHRDEFVTVLRRRNGTLALTWLHLLEFSKVVSDATTSEAEWLLLPLCP